MEGLRDGEDLGVEEGGFEIEDCGCGCERHFWWVSFWGWLLLLLSCGDVVERKRVVSCGGATRGVGRALGYGTCARDLFDVQEICGIYLHSKDLNNFFG